jgi:hypothetical protein
MEFDIPKPHWLQAPEGSFAWQGQILLDLWGAASRELHAGSPRERSEASGIRFRRPGLLRGFDGDSVRTGACFDDNLDGDDIMLSPFVVDRDLL